jgi:hypothetical protein
MAYATLEDIFLRWGETNVRDMANLDSDNPRSLVVTERIEYFLQIQSDEIEARLLGCAYKVPFDPIPPVIRTLCAELAYLAMYRVRHSTDGTAPDPFMYVTQRHNQIFADIHARRFRLGGERHSFDVPLIVEKRQKVLIPPAANFAKVYTDGTLQGDGTASHPLSVVQNDFSLGHLGIDVSHLPEGSFIAIGEQGFIQADKQHPHIIGFKVGKTILTHGVVENEEWNWEAGKYVMLGENGLTQSASDVLIRVGIAMSPHRVFLKFEYGFF